MKLVTLLHVIGQVVHFCAIDLLLPAVILLSLWLWNSGFPAATPRLRWREALAVSLLFALEMGVTLPSLAFMPNANEFIHAYKEFLVPLLIISLAIFASLSLVFAVIKDSPRGGERLMTGLLIVGIGAWIQSNFDPISVDALTGNKLVLNDGWAAAKDVALWLWVVLGVVLLRPMVFSRLLQVMWTLVLFQLVLVGWSYRAIDPTTESFKFKVTSDKDLFTFSKQKNVIVLLLDGFQGNIFNQFVNGGRTPSQSTSQSMTPSYVSGDPWRQALQGFTYYQNATSTFMSTLYSVPNLLTATLYDNSVPYRTYISRIAKTNNLFSILHRAGIQVSASHDREWVFSGQLLPVSDDVQRPIDFTGAVRDLPLLYDLTLMKSMPYFLKNQVYNDGQWFLSRAAQRLSSDRQDAFIPVPICSKASDIEFLNQLHAEAQVTIDTPTFKFIHLRTPHPPYDIDQNLHAREHTGLDLADYEVSAQAGLRILQLFVDELKRLKVYDNSVIFVVSDHGLGHPINPSEQTVRNGEAWMPKQIDTFNFIKGRFSPTILVKPFESRGAFQVSEAPVTLGDLPQTIVQVLNVHYDFSGEGHLYRSLFDSKENDVRTRWARYYMLLRPPQLYVTPAVEFRIDGHSWDDASWHFTHRVYVKERGLMRISPQMGADFVSALESSNTSYYEKR